LVSPLIAPTVEPKVKQPYTQSLVTFVLGADYHASKTKKYAFIKSKTK
jgi:hypothetical protein